VRRGQQGTAAIELVGVLPLMLIAALAAWQGLLMTYSATAAQDAARTGSRASGLGRNGEAAAVGAVSSWLRPGVTATSTGERMTVHIKVPVVVPGLTFGGLTVSRSAELPGQ
jgi:hypothetical protein